MVDALNRVPTEHPGIECALCFLFRAENAVDGGAADGALPFESGLAILHGDALRVFHLALGFALDTVVLICHVNFLLTMVYFKKR